MQPDLTTPGGAGSPAAVTQRSRLALVGRATLELGLRLGGLFIAILIVGAVFTLLEPNFLTVDVIVSILRSMSSIAIIGLGLTLVIVVGEIDLSFGATYGVAANVLAVLWILHGVSVYLAILLALGAGIAVGIFNGMLVTLLKIPSFIVTLGTYNLLYGVSLYISKSSTYNPAYPPPDAEIPKGELDFFTGLSTQSLPRGISAEVLWLVGLAVVIGFLLHRSLFGFRLTAIGGNPLAATLARLPVRRYKILAFVLCGLLAAAAGILDFAFIGSVQPDAGLAFTFPVFAAVIIGGASLAGGRGTVVGTLAGSLLLATLSTGLALTAAGPFAQQVFLGAVTIGAVALDLYTTKVATRVA